MNLFLGLVLLTSAIPSVRPRPATSCDASSVANLVRILEIRRNETIRDLQRLRDAHDWLIKLSERFTAEVDAAVVSVDSHIQSQGANAQKDATNMFNGFARNRFYKYMGAINVILNVARKDGDAKVNEYIANQSNWLRDEWSGKVIKSIRDEMTWQKTRDRKTGLANFEKYLNERKSQITSNEGLVKIADQLSYVSRQVQLQQFNEFEKTRSDGSTGVKQIRTKTVGEKNYHSNDHNGDSILGIKDLPSKNNLGIDEFSAVINGIEFRSNQKKYELKKPVSNNEEMHKTESIHLPSVPASVLAKQSVDDQIAEMREYFKAFQYQDHTIRNYYQYFKPILSYLEGAWLYNKEAISSAEQIQYESYSGFSSNAAYTPATIMGFTEATKPIFTSWDYRILAHEIDTENYFLPTNLKPKYDPTTLRRHNIEDDYGMKTRRFDLEGIDVERNYERMSNREVYYSLLDELMEQIPGKNNYGKILTGRPFDNAAALILSGHPKRRGQTLNVAHYHRPYVLSSADAMGDVKVARSFSDRLYVAYTDHDIVVGPTYPSTTGVISSNVSYAMPLEVVYLSPLSDWNPMAIDTDLMCDGITGDGTKSNPYSHACPEKYYLTPQKFYTGADNYDCINDGTEGVEAFYFLSTITKSGVCMVSSGTRIVHPKISGIAGKVRQRYPIMPVHGEGSAAWKKLDALVDIINDNMPNIVHTHHKRFHTGISKRPRYPPHQHEVVITKANYDMLINDRTGQKYLRVATKPDDFHQHIFTIKKIPGSQRIGVTSCNSNSDPANVPTGDIADETVFCFDMHPNVIIEIHDN